VGNVCKIADGCRDNVKGAGHAVIMSDMLQLVACLIRLQFVLCPINFSLSVISDF